MDASEWSAIVIGVLGVAGLIFTALKYNRDDTSAIVTQQNVIVAELKDLSSELRTQRDEAKSACDDCLAEIARLRG